MIPYPKFIVGVAQQPVESVGKWKSLGINTFVDIPADPKNPNTEAQNKAWVDAVSSAGIFQIRKPIDSIRSDANEYLLAYNHPDEPDLKGINPQVLLDEYYSGSYHVPWMVNFSGGVLLNKVPSPKLGANEYRKYVGSSDWFCHDIYPVSGWNNSIDLYSGIECVKLLRDYTKGKPQLAYVECAKQNLSWLPDGGRAPTVAEVDCQIRGLILEGVKGIIFFPQSFGPYSPDNTTPEMKQYIRKFSEEMSI